MTPRGLLRLLLLLLSGMAEASVDLGDPRANNVKRTPTTYALHPTLYELTPRLLKDRLDLGLSRAAEATANLRVPSAIDGTRNGFGLEFPLDGLNVNVRILSILSLDFVVEIEDLTFKSLTYLAPRII